ncbi:MAG: DUF4160 domain-containing protein [Coriobacteriales bacterium]|jgi:hypothetical protein|nr:DUF4160 domain-containing protein [Coriobacteriales bacterium]
MSPRYSYFLDYAIFIYSNEGDEPIHVHVAKTGSPQNNSKFWVRSDSIEIAHNQARIPAHRIKKIETYLALNAEHIIAFWKSHFE